MTDTEAWGQLVSLTDFESDPLPLIRDSFVIGRAKDCDLPFPENKLVSSRHCCVQRDEEGKVWLCDSSTNGTLLNLKLKITKGNKKELKHGDEFHVVYKKGEEEKNIGFVYQSMEELAKEDSSEMEQTQEYDTGANIMDATLIDSDNNVVDETDEGEDLGRKRSKENDNTEPKAKIAKLSDDSKSANEESKDKTEEPSGDNSEKSKEEISQEELSKLKSEGGTKPVATTAVDEIEETLLCSICQELLYNCISLQPCMHSYCAGCYSDWMKKSNECPTCRMKVKRINKNHIVNNLIEAYLKEHPEKKRPEEDLKELDAKNKITKEMMTPLAKDGYDNDEDVTDDEEDYNDSDDPEDLGNNNVDPPQLVHFPPAVLPPAPPRPVLFGFGTPFFGATQQAQTKCRQCPGYVPPDAPPQPGILQTAINAVGTALGLKPGDEAAKGEEETKAETSDSQATESLGETPGPSTSDGKTIDPELKDEKNMPTPPNHVCTAFQNHVLCQCCLQPMPDFRANPRGTPQQCAICYRNYCHAYWGCKKAECQGCIGKFKDLNFGKKSLNNLILENIYESEIFKNYLEDKGITVKQVLRDSLQKLEAGTYTCPDQYRTTINSNTALCYTCGLRNFKELAYQYRKDIPKQDFPEDVQKREDCYWGKNCRTQRTRPHHAKNFSHVCDQIRTT